MSALLNWLNGWRWDLDGFLVRARRSADPSSLPSECGLVEESAVAVRSHAIARHLDCGRPLLVTES